MNVSTVEPAEILNDHALNPAEPIQPNELPDAEAPAPGLRGSDAELGLTVIEAQSGWQLLDLRELWRYRELLYFLAWRDVKIRYKQTVLGGAWAILQPFATMVVFTLFVGRLAGATDGATPYPLFVFAGLLPWFFFANSITAASQSVVSNQNLVTKVYFPRFLITVGSMGASLLDFVIAFGMLMALMLFYATVPSWTLVLAPIVFLTMVLPAIGLSALLSALTVTYRDFRHVVPFMMQVWMFATPIIYLPPETVAGPTAQWLLPLNPAYGLILNFRSVVLGQPFDYYAFAVSTAVGVLLFVVGCFYFRRVERGFADII